MVALPPEVAELLAFRSESYGTILTHLLNESITSEQALRLYKIRRVAPRILEMRNDGHKIVTRKVMEDGRLVGRYHLLELNKKAMS